MHAKVINIFMRCIHINLGGSVFINPVLYTISLFPLSTRRHNHYLVLVSGLIA